MSASELSPIRKVINSGWPYNATWSIRRRARGDVPLSTQALQQQGTSRLLVVMVKAACKTPFWAATHLRKPLTMAGE